MSEEKKQSGGTATAEPPTGNTVEVTFLPEGKTVQFEHGKLKYFNHARRNRFSCRIETMTSAAISSRSLRHPASR